MNMFELIFSYSTGIVLHLGVINLVAAAVTICDKKQAHTHGWRVPKKNLFTLVVLDDSSAMLVTMHIIRHKIQYKCFVLGLLFIILA